MSTATPTDVLGVIDTDLSDSDIQSYLDTAEFLAEQANDNYASESTELRTQLESHLAALMIVQSKDRRVASASRQSASIEYDGDTVAWLKRMVHRFDPSGSLGYNIDSDRHIASTREVSD